jgi:putative membrane protein
MRWDTMGDWWWLMAIGMTLFWVVVIWAVVVFVRGRTGVDTRAEARPEDTLKQRFARGELTEADYERSLKLIRG